MFCWRCIFFSLYAQQGCMRLTFTAIEGHRVNCSLRPTQGMRLTFTAIERHRVTSSPLPTQGMRPSFTAIEGHRVYSSLPPTQDSLMRFISPFLTHHHQVTAASPPHPMSRQWRTHRRNSPSGSVHSSTWARCWELTPSMRYPRLRLEETWFCCFDF